MIKSVSEILLVLTDQEMKKEFGDFEAGLDAAVAPLRALLSKDVRSTEVPVVMDHMSKVESYREKIVKYLALAAAFHGHAKSDHFIVKKIKGLTEFDRAAYQKTLTAGFSAIELYLEGLVDCIDSRVNLCKRLLGIEFDGQKFGSKGV